MFRRLLVCLAIPGKIVELFPESHRSALVDVAGVRRRVDLGLIEEEKPVPGDWVLIHVGFALSKISEEDALDQMRILQALGEDKAAMEEVRGYGLGEEPEIRRQESEVRSKEPEV
jgi:hydrogenase expression/formation protein HypC